jgi:hypothetical protein
MNRLLLAALLLAAPAAGLAQASAVPTRISYQGKVTDAAGVPVGNASPVNRVVTFRVWKSPTSVAAADRLYSEQQTVTIAAGEFSVLLGAGSAVAGENNQGTLDAIFNGETRFLGITIDDPAVVTDPEISPRQQIVANAYAFRAKVAEAVASQAVTSAMLANNAVGTAQVADAAVTLGKLAADSVDATKISDNAVGSAEIAAGAVTAAKLGADVAVWSVNGTTAFRPTGSVGIGTNAPSAPLDVYDANNPRIGFHTPLSTVNATRGLFVGLNNGGPAYVFNWENSHLDFGTNGLIRQRIESDGRIGFGVLNGDTNLNFYFKGNKTHIAKFQNAAGAEIFTIRDYNSVAIGHAAPTASLDIWAPTYPSVILKSNKTGLGDNRGTRFFMDDFTPYRTSGIWAYESSSMDFATSNIRRMRIEPDGRMGFNYDNGDGNVSFYFKALTQTTPGNPANEHVAFRIMNGNFTEIAAFRNDGNAYKPGGGSWSASSDARLKHDIRDLSGALGKLMQLRPVTFRYNDGKRYGEGLRTGFIAQEMEKVYPEWVTQTADGMKAIGFSGFESVAVQALRELRAEKDAQLAAAQARIADLEAQLRVLASAQAGAEERFIALERRIQKLATGALAAATARE